MTTKFQDTTPGALNQSRRRERLTQAAQAAGYQTIDRLAAAINRGEIKMTDTRLQIRDIETGEVLGRVLTNRGLSFDEAMRIAGAEYYEGNDSGWSFDDGLNCYDESTAELYDPLDMTSE